VGLRHPLQSAHSPLIRALPDYEAQFQQQLGEARAYWEASQQRLHRLVIISSGPAAHNSCPVVGVLLFAMVGPGSKLTAADKMILL
jgi:hypothetical protein